MISPSIRKAGAGSGKETSATLPENGELGTGGGCGLRCGLESSGNLRSGDSMRTVLSAR